MAVRCKASVCGRSLAGIVGSNLAGGMDACVVCFNYRQNTGQWRQGTEQVRTKYKQSKREFKKFWWGRELKKKCGLRKECAADRLLELQVRIPPGAWRFVFCVVIEGKIRDSKDKETNTDEVQST